MSKFKYFWIVLAGLTPLSASGVNAQSFGAPIDILGPVQEDLIREVRQNPSSTGSRNTSPARYGKVSPKFINALQQCDNETIARHIALNRVVEDVYFYPPQLLRRAYQCGAISSARLEQMLNYQRRYFQIDQPGTTTNLTPPPKRSPGNNYPIAPKFIQALQNCDNGYISGYVAGRRAAKLPIPQQMLQKAQECGAI